MSAAPLLGRLRIEYAVHYARPNGRTGRKVFKISESQSTAAARVISRRQSCADLSTRRHHPGPHRLTILINGRPKADIEFQLLLPSAPAGSIGP